jgi:hypothetical protein
MFLLALLNNSSSVCKRKIERTEDGNYRLFAANEKRKTETENEILFSLVGKR